MLKLSQVHSARPSFNASSSIRSGSTQVGALIGGISPLTGPLWLTPGALSIPGLRPGVVGVVGDGTPTCPTPRPPTRFPRLGRDACRESRARVYSPLLWCRSGCGVAAEADVGVMIAAEPDASAVLGE